MEVSAAIVLWTGWRRTARPARDDALLTSEYGPARADRLLTEIRRLEAVFYESDAHLTTPDLASMGRQAAEDFRSAHPDIDEDAVHAFAWCYTFDYK